MGAMAGLSDQDKSRANLSNFSGDTAIGSLLKHVLEKEGKLPAYEYKFWSLYWQGNPHTGQKLRNAAIVERALNAQEDWLENLKS